METFLFPREQPEPEQFREPAEEREDQRVMRMTEAAERRGNKRKEPESTPAKRGRKKKTKAASKFPAKLDVKQSIDYEHP